MVLLVLYLGKCGVSKHSKVADGGFWRILRGTPLKFNMEPGNDGFYPLESPFPRGPHFQVNHVCFGGVYG